jgi:hypothetical protein
VSTVTLSFPVHAVKVHVGVEAQLYEFLTPVLSGGEWSDLLPGYFLGGRDTHLVEGWVCPRASPDF